ncbi:MAG: sugar ABC transporter substrate-binding protein [Anaerolineae bacterium]|nr:sugar ABC transporter substrate-binding protein [Anaerolineae bacterium]
MRKIVQAGGLFLLVMLLVGAVAISAQDSVTMRLATWQWEDPSYKDFWTGTVDAFEEANPGVTIEPFNFPIDQLWDRLNIEIAAGTPPDLLEVTGFNVFQYMNQGVLAPLNQCFEGTDIIDKVIGEDSYAVDDDGNIYALNLSARTLQLYVNRQLFDEAGIAVPTNNAELMAAAQALTDPAKEQYGLVLVNLPHSRMYEAVLDFVTGYGGHFSTDGQANFTAPAVIQGVQFFKDMFDAGVMPQGVADGGAQYSYFNSGKVAMSIDGAWYWSVLEQNAPDLIEHVEIYPMPTDTQIPTGGVNNLIGIAAGSPNYDTACEYLKFIATPEWGQVWTSRSRTAFTYEGSVTDEFLAENPWFSVFAQELPKAVPVAIPGLEIYHNDMVRLINNRLVEVLYDNKPVEQAMEELQADVDEFIEDQQ